MKILVISFFNSKNLGDIVLSNQLANRFNGFGCVTKVSYVGKASELTDINNININTNMSGKNVPEKVMNKIYRVLGLNDINLRFIFKQIEKNDLVIIGGGNMIYDSNFHTKSYLRFQKIIDYAKKNNKLIYGVSLGIGPFQTEEQKKGAIESLEVCDYLSFRDEASYNLFKECSTRKKNIFRTVDPAFFLDYELQINKKKYIAFNVFDNRLIDDSYEEYISFMSIYILIIKKLLDSQNLDVVLFSTDLNDYQAITYIHHQLKKELSLSEYNRIKVSFINGMNDLLNLYSSSLILIGTRMHSMIIAITQYIPILGISWQPKVKSFFSTINQVESCFEYKDVDINKLIQHALCKINNHEKESEILKENIQNIRLKDSDRIIMKSIMGEIKSE